MNTDFSSYLISSESKRKLLRFFWVEKGMGSIRDLSSLTDVSYASTYEEVKKMEELGLVTRESSAGSTCYKANLENPFSSFMQDLFKTPDSSSQKILRTSFQKLSLEEALAQDIKNSRKNPSLVRILPVLLAKSFEEIHLDKLKIHCKRLGQQRVLGFFLDLTAELSGIAKFKNFSKGLVDKRVKRNEYFFSSPKNKYEIKLIGMNTPAIAKKWHFLMNLKLDSFQDIFEKNTK